MEKPKLTDGQLSQMEVFGFLHFPGLLSNRIDAIINAFEAVWADRGGGHGGHPHTGEARSCIVPFIDQSEYLSSLLDDPRIDWVDMTDDPEEGAKSAIEAAKTWRR